MYTRALIFSNPPNLLITNIPILQQILIATLGAMVGFALMMVLDVALC